MLLAICRSFWSPRPVRVYRDVGLAIAPGSLGGNHCTMGSPHSGLHPVCGLRQTVGTTNEGNTSSNSYRYIFVDKKKKTFFHMEIFI